MFLLANHCWPDSLDKSTIVAFLALTIGLPLLGYYLTVIDLCAYLRALRGALVRVVCYLPELPDWAQYETPGCLRALGLTMPCTEDDIKRAYHRQAERLHPDRGGDRRRFLIVHQHFEAALRYVRDLPPRYECSVKS